MYNLGKFVGQQTRCNHQMQSNPSDFISQQCISVRDLSIETREVSDPAKSESNLDQDSFQYGCSSMQLAFREIFSAHQSQQLGCSLLAACWGRGGGRGEHIYIDRQWGCLFEWWLLDVLATIFSQFGSIELLLKALKFEQP